MTDLEMTITEEDVEIAARAMVIYHGADPDGLTHGNTVPRWKNWVGAARAALEAVKTNKARGAG